MAKKMNNNYGGKAFASDVNNVKKSTLLKTGESSMIMRPQLIGSYYKNRKKVRNIAYWMNVINNNDVEALSQLKQA